jgi:acetyl esterase/lipase
LLLTIPAFGKISADLNGICKIAKFRMGNGEKKGLPRRIEPDFYHGQIVVHRRIAAPGIYSFQKTFCPGRTVGHFEIAGQAVIMIDEINDGKTIFYDFYTEQQKQENPTKESTGLFFFRGKPVAPFAIVCPGGGFAYVGSLHEGFPHAVDLSKKGYNAFVLKYRVGGELSATENLAAAISYIFRNAEIFEVSVENYSLWGFSAGARMVGNIALDGTAGFGGDGLPKPRIVVIAYTGHTSFSENYPPVFVT